MIAILLWYVGITLLLAALLAAVSLAQWSVTTCKGRLRPGSVQAPQPGPAARPLVSGAAPPG